MTLPERAPLITDRTPRDEHIPKWENTATFDMETFLRARDVLHERFIHTSEDDRKSILIARGIDTLSDPYETGFANEFSILIPSLRLSHLSHNTGEMYGTSRTLSSIFDPQSPADPHSGESPTYYYGMGKITHVVPGELVTLTALNEEDVLLSANFTSCCAVVGRSTDGRTSLAHILDASSKANITSMLKVIELLATESNATDFSVLYSYLDDQDRVNAEEQFKGTSFLSYPRDAVDADFLSRKLDSRALILTQKHMQLVPIKLEGTRGTRKATVSNIA